MSSTDSRRGFLKHSLCTGAGLLLAAHLPRPKALEAAAASAAPAVLTRAEWATVEAMTGCIIPTDHQPGALEANCVNFIDKALANEDAAAVPLYKGGLAAIDGALKAVVGKPFTALAYSEQIAFLRKLEGNEVEGWPLGTELPSAVFFETLRMQTIIGFLAAPRYGGNRDYIGWQVAGYPGTEHHSGGYTKEQVEGSEPIVPVWVKGAK